MNTDTRARKIAWNEALLTKLLKNRRDYTRQGISRVIERLRFYRSFN